jgi:Zn-finger nucleic acid-binding protein
VRILKCPVCKEAMIVAAYGAVEIDSCAVCGGIWLDRGELEALVGRPVAPHDNPDPSLGPPDRDCPICVAKLAKDRYGSTQVVIDRCPHGDGVWLDAGELVQILDAYHQSQAEPGHHHDEHAGGALTQFFGRRSPKKPSPKG